MHEEKIISIGRHPEFKRHKGNHTKNPQAQNAEIIHMPEVLEDKPNTEHFRLTVTDSTGKTFLLTQKNDKTLALVPKEHAVHIDEFTFNSQDELDLFVKTMITPHFDNPHIAVKKIDPEDDNPVVIDVG